jgi:predicted DNA-binding transcriptional regulator YafY
MYHFQADIMSSVEIKWDQAIRFRLIEIIALWEGRLTTKHLCSAFRIGRQQASRDINRYIELFENPPLTLDRSIKGYVPSEHFKPKYTRGTTNEYLTLIHQQREIVSSFDVVEMGFAQTEVVLVPDRMTTPAIVRGLIKAAREQRRIDIDYVSLSNPTVEGRNMVPHTIVNDGFRWHVRAYCEKNGNFRDFVLSRFRNKPEVLDKSEFGREQDTDWNEMIDFAVIPNPFLNADQRRIVADDYAMQNNELYVTSRKSLVKYAINRLNICMDEKQLKGSPSQYQLTVSDIKMVKQYLIPKSKL